MVCPLGNGRMAAMARLLASGSFSQSIVAEEVGHQKLAAQLIFRELSEADEPNLLDEEDMHVFGVKPMADPLHLVCCNTCKKPVKTSQYAAHAELCTILKSKGELILGIDGDVRQRKPMRKERKKSLSVYAMSIEEFQRSESVNADDTAIAESQLDRKIGINSSCLMEAKRNSSYVDVKSLMDGSGVGLGNIDNLASVMPRPTKRTKLIAGQTSPKASISESEIPNDSGAGFKKHEQVLGCCVPIQDVPLPLATKIYYSQRNNRLRSALCHLYYEAEATTKEFCSDSVKTKLSNENMYPTQVSSQDMLPTQMNNAVNNERDSLSLPSVQNPDQILAQSSEVCLGTSGVCLPPSDFSKQFPVDNVQRLQVAPVGLARNTYLSKPFSFATSSGQPLGAAQQQNGSVSVL
ncbi:uncharacterized protein LOC21391822 isoform X2 [Morus notabilis]|uniref:uncharacterized protein LOC21391822 isoform X2 n=1 Tax=Morus notabilis TaxID=981085 RepID=UPI000CED7CC1|nr:uncharacterized protein LOC21391822 isoform X2 [Morus notabilis]